MAINKINLDGIEYGLGEAKLVATGTLSTSSYDSFYLDNKLEPNKIYLIRLYEEWNDSHFECIITTLDYGENIFSTTSSIPWFDVDEAVVCCSLFYFYNHSDNSSTLRINSLYYGSDSISELIESDTSTCEVYELPITLGGNE